MRTALGSATTFALAVPLEVVATNVEITAVSASNVGCYVGAVYGIRCRGAARLDVCSCTIAEFSIRLALAHVSAASEEQNERGQEHGCLPPDIHTNVMSPGVHAIRA
jgi:hypothetical protein